MRTSFVVGAIALSFSLGALAQQPPEMCNLTKATIFHDNHIGNLPQTFGVYSIISAAAPGGFVITSENGTFPPITATRDSAGHISAFFPNLNKTLEGQVQGSPSCDVFYWGSPGVGTVQLWARGPLPPPSAPCKFSKSDNRTGLWHSQEHQAIKDKVFTFDSIDDSHFTIHSLNGTFDDTTATVVNPPSGSCKTVTVQFSDRQNMSHGFLSECRFLEFLSDSGGFLGNWQQGPIPPPPPPPPAQCVTSFNQTACDAVKHTATDSCVWCTSNDGDHSLCFHKSNEPDSGSWKCDGAAATRAF